MPNKFTGAGGQRLKRLPSAKSLLKRDLRAGQFGPLQAAVAGYGYHLVEGRPPADLEAGIGGATAQRLTVEGVDIGGVVLSTVSGRGLDGAEETGYVVRRPDDSLATVLVRSGPEGRSVTVTAIPSGAELMANTPPLDQDDLVWVDAPASGREML